MNRFMLCTLCMFLAVGCGDVYLEALTVPPPGKVATLDADNHTLELSRGIAFAFSCTETGGYSGPCRDATITSSEPAIATAFASYLDELDRAYDGGDLGPRSKAAFVVVGMTPGTTDVRVTTEGDDVTVSVTVVP